MFGTIAKVGIVAILGLAAWVWWQRSKADSPLVGDLTSITLSPEAMQNMVRGLNLNLTVPEAGSEA